MPHRWIRREPFSLWKALCKEELCLCWGEVTVNLGKWMCLSLRIQTPTAGTGVVPSTMGTMDRGSAWLRALFFRNSRPEMTRSYSAFPAGLGQLMPNHARNNSAQAKSLSGTKSEICCKDKVVLVIIGLMFERSRSSWHSVLWTTLGKGA